MSRLPYTYQNLGPSWSWSYGSWIYNYLNNQCLSKLKVWVQTPFMVSMFDTTICDKVFQWLARGRWFSLGTPVPSTNKSDHHGKTEILLKAALNTISPKIPTKYSNVTCQFVIPVRDIHLPIPTSTVRLFKHIPKAWYFTDQFIIPVHDFLSQKNLLSTI
jgi:hypothetical protein